MKVRLVLGVYQLDQRGISSVSLVSSGKTRNNLCKLLDMCQNIMLIFKKDKKHKKSTYFHDISTSWNARHHIKSLQKERSLSLKIFWIQLQSRVLLQSLVQKPHLFAEFRMISLQIPLKKALFVGFRPILSGPFPALPSPNFHSRDSLITASK